MPLESEKKYSFVSIVTIRYSKAWSCTVFGSWKYRPGYIYLFGENKEGNSSDSLKILGKGQPHDHIS
jgi:hypothetical protein